MTDLTFFDDVEDPPDPYVPCCVEKATLLPRLRAALLPETIPLSEALERFAIDAVRNELIEFCGDRPGLCEFGAELLSPVTAVELRDWPAWYVRLPVEWEADITRLAAAEYLSPHLLRDAYNPWNVAQWIAIVSEDRGEGWPSQARRIEVDEDDLSLTFSKPVRSDAGLLVLFECGNFLTSTAYPIDDGLIGCLQGGGVASSRHPLFDASLNELQAMTRALEDGIEPPCDADALRLEVTRVGREPTRISHREWLEHVCTSRGPYISRKLLSDARWGSLQSVYAEGLPAAWLEQGVKVLQLTLPYELHERFLDETPAVKVEFVRAEGDEPDTVLLALTRGRDLYVVELRLDEPAAYQALRTMAAQGVCRLAVVNFHNGRAYPMEFDWPAMPAPWPGAVPREASLKDEVLPPENPQVTVLAKQLMERLGRTVFLHTAGVCCSDERSS